MTTGMGIEDGTCQQGSPTGQSDYLYIVGTQSVANITYSILCVIFTTDLNN